MELSHTLDALRAAADRAGAALELPRFEKTPAAIEATAKAAMEEADRRLDRLAAEDVVRSFLGRERSNEPFLRSLGIGAP